MLSNGNDSRLMVSSTVDGRKFVHSSGQSTIDVCGKDTAYCSGVQSLEENEFRRVSRCCLGERRKGFDDDVGVTDDLACRVELLRCGEVVRVSVNEESSLHAGNIHRDSEVG